MSDRRTTILGSFVVSMLAICGCGDPGTRTDTSAGEPIVMEEISVSGFDPDGEPVIRRWSDGTVSIVFVAMPPFFAEEQGIDGDFADFKTRLEAALGVVVIQDDREVFVIESPLSDTAEKAKTWLEGFHH